MTGILTAAVLLLTLIEAGLTCFMYPVPPKIVFPAQEKIEVQPGTNFTLKCTNFFRLRWETPGNNMERTSTEEVQLNEDNVSVELYESTLTRTDVTLEDSGYYSCIQLGHDSHKGTTSDKIYVHVAGAPLESDPENNEEQPKYRVKLSYEFKEGNLEIICRGLLEETPYHMFWQGPSRLARQNGQIRLQRLPLETGDDKKIAVHKLTVADVSEKNNGLYTCTLTYRSGQEYSASLALSGHNVQIFEETSNELKQE